MAGTQSLATRVSISTSPYVELFKAVTQVCSQLVQIVIKNLCKPWFLSSMGLWANLGYFMLILAQRGTNLKNNHCSPPCYSEFLFLGSHCRSQAPRFIPHSIKKRGYPLSHIDLCIIIYGNSYFCCQRKKIKLCQVEVGLQQVTPKMTSVRASPEGKLKLGSIFRVTSSTRTLTVHSVLFLCKQQT